MYCTIEINEIIVVLHSLVLFVPPCIKSCIKILNLFIILQFENLIEILPQGKNNKLVLGQRLNERIWG